MRLSRQTFPAILKPTLLGAALLLFIATVQHLFVSHTPLTPRNFMLPLLVGSIAGICIGFYNLRLRQREEHLQEAFNEVWQTAFFDKLTGLPNRTLLLDRLRQQIMLSRRKNERLAVLVLGVDRFKRFNETLGYGVGDQVLLLVAERLAACVRESDTVARLGGDEFALLMPRINQPDDAALVAAKVLESLAVPMELCDQELFCTTSIGIALFPMDGDEDEDILKHADIAMHHTKSAGGNHFRFYSWFMNQQAAERLNMEANLQRGLERGDFHLHYQPQFDLKSGQIVGVEALLRWNMPGVGTISPALFIPLAEETGLIQQLGIWVLRTACEQAVTWQQAGLPPIRMAVNLSMRQFRQKDLTETISTVLQETGLPPWRLELEVTESCFTDRPDEAVDILRALKQLGVKLSIDDFGTGYSSLSYLKLFPIDHLKIAMPFVQDITNSQEDAAIAEAIIVMAHTLKLRVVAEGVETDEQRRFLTQKQCDIVQGYLFSRPVPPDRIERLLCASSDTHDNQPAALLHSLTLAPHCA